MAGAQCAPTSFLLSSAKASQAPRKPVPLLCSISTPFPSNLTRRKNHLRQKLLKTLTKPCPKRLLLESPPENPVNESPKEQQPESPCDQIAGDEETKESEAQEFRISETSETAGVFNGDFGKFSTGSVLKLGLYLVGAFVFQTICALWVFGSANSDHKDGNLDTGGKNRVLGLGLNGNNDEKSSVLLNGSGNPFSGKLGYKEDGIVYVGGFELEEKIAEIQAMARDARESERLDSKVNGSDNDDVVITGIEKEVDSKLVKLRKSLQNSSEKSPVFPVSYLRKDGEVEDAVDGDSLDTKDANKPLMFKKKNRFRSPSANLSDKPKGFQGPEDHSITRSRNSSSDIADEPLRNFSVDNDSTDLLNKEQQVDQPNGNSRGSVSLPSEKDDERKSSKDKSKSFQTPRKKLGKERAKTKLGKENGVAKSEPGNGAMQQTGRGRPSAKRVKSRKSSMFDAENSQSLTKEIPETTTISKEHDTLLGNDILKCEEVGSKRAAGKVEGRQSDDKADLWWLSLPYVLVILMRRGHDGEGPNGLFTLKTTPYTKDKGESSHTVAFEDRGDATNFCYLLQSFFEDLGDFSADIVPLPIKELNEAVRSHTMKVIVVKKGQLKLYAGQPLAEAEMALRSLVK